MFLYCILVYEHQSEEIFSFIPPERAENLKKELKKLERFPKEVRLTLMMKLIGYIISRVRNPRMEMVHSSWITEVLKKEDSQVALAIISEFPEDYQKQIAKALGLPDQPIQDSGRYSDDVKEIIFQIFCNEFVSMQLPLEPGLSLGTLYLFREEDLMVLMRHVGVRELARAFVLAGMDVLAALVSRFPEDLKKDFLDGVKSGKQDPERQKLAARRAG
ncbi:MAG: hypothetical protein C5B54_10510, partial [Acidobacteria bacterium]